MPVPDHALKREGPFAGVALISDYANVMLELKTDAIVGSNEIDFSSLLGCVKIDRLPIIPKRHGKDIGDVVSCQSQSANLGILDDA
jgi:hypothetical protein